MKLRLLNYVQKDSRDEPSRFQLQVLFDILWQALMMISQDVELFNKHPCLLLVKILFLNELWFLVQTRVFAQL